MNDPTAKEDLPNGINGDQVAHNDNEHDSDDEGNDTIQNVFAVSSASQVREFREPSAASAASDQNSTPTRSPSRQQNPLAQQQPQPPQPPQRPHHRHHHHHQQQQHRQHRTAATADPLTPPSPPPTQLAAQSPVFANPARASAAVANAGKVNATIDDPDDVTPTKSLAANASPLAKVHRRPGAAAAAAAFGVQSFSDPTASPSGSRHHHQHHYGKQSSASSAGSHRPASAAGAAATAAAIGLNGEASGVASGHQASAASLPTATSSPAHRKRSKSESRRRRERKMIAAGELEVRQANETLMRYLRQCTEINDASLSGELEIDQSYDDRRVHRKTRSQRERRGFHMGGAGTGGVGGGGGGFGGHSTSSAAAAAALAVAGGAGAGAAGGVVGARGRLQLQNGLTNILNSLVEDIRPANGGGADGSSGGGGGTAGSAEIYNPFTPVISPSEGAPHMGIGSKMFVQHHHYRRDVDDGLGDEDVFGRGDVENGMGSASPLVQSIIDMSCTVQRFWILLSNLCHGLLGGLAFAHLLLVMTTNPYDWLGNHGGAGEESTGSGDGDGLRRGSTLAHAYASSFYALAVVCLVSVFDRMDFCRLNSSFSEAISFRWVIVLMLYLATNILSLSTEATIEHNDFSITNSTEWLEKMENNRVLDVWNSLSIVRSVCALFGWLLVGMFPQDDMLFDHLADMEKHQLR